MPIQKPELDDETFSSFSKSFRGDAQRSLYVNGSNKEKNQQNNKPLILAAKKSPFS